MGRVGRERPPPVGERAPRRSPGRNRSQEGRLRGDVVPRLARAWRLAGGGGARSREGSALSRGGEAEGEAPFLI